MKVQLGTLEVTDEQALALGTVGARGGRKPASREQVKTWALAQIEAQLKEASERAAEYGTEGVIGFTEDDIPVIGERSCPHAGPDPHWFPIGPKTADTRCYCGERRWGGR